MITVFFGMWINVLVAIVKEIQDEYDYKGFDWKDLISGIAGGLPVFLLS